MLHRSQLLHLWLWHASAVLNGTCNQIQRNFNCDAARKSMNSMIQGVRRVQIVGPGAAWQSSRWYRHRLVYQWRNGKRSTAHKTMATYQASSTFGHMIPRLDGAPSTATSDLYLWLHPHMTHGRIRNAHRVASLLSNSNGMSVWWICRLEPQGPAWEGVGGGG